MGAAAKAALQRYLVWVINDIAFGKFESAAALQMARVIAEQHKAYIEDVTAGSTGPIGKDFNMRWVASLVAETHRILSRGGVFLYPGDARKGYENGRLRMVYECAPIAFVIEQAQGHATDGQNRLMDHSANALHARTPLVFGSAEKVDRVASYYRK